jgi:hypothetical protein
MHGTFGDLLPDVDLAPFRDEQEEEGLGSFDLLYRYLPNVQKWYYFISPKSPDLVPRCP